jgi:gamma-glutamyltranspeptidase/glutathione hydrolase
MAGGAALAALLAASWALGAGPPPTRGRAAVAADQPLASEAGAEVLRAGGNAVDAAVAAALAAGVVQPAGSGLGGGGFGLATRAGGAPVFLDFREVAPAAVDANALRAPNASRVGGRAVAVPSQSRGLAALIACCGALSPARVAAPAIRLAAHGFPVGPHLAGGLARTTADDVRRLFARGEAPAVEGDRVANPALAKTLRAWAASRGEDLASGAGAAAIAAEVAAADGWVTTADLSATQVRERPPIIAHYRGWTVVTAPPPSSGGVVLAQALGVLEGVDLDFGVEPASAALNSAEYVHTLVEVLKHAYADRAWYLGDPDFVDPGVARLLAPARIEEIRRAVVPDRTFPPDHYGPAMPPPKDAGTQHISALDAHGGACALTTTINTSFGSGLVVEPLGIVLNNQMDDFALAPGVPNAYGLVGAAANAVAPGKRPLSSMSPTLLLSADGEVTLVIGGSGGSNIPSAVLQVIVDIVDFGLDPAEAVSLPRFHHQWIPDELVLEPGFPEDVARALRARGHVVVFREGASAVQVVRRIEGGLAEAASDPRKDGRPASVW